MSAIGKKLAAVSQSYAEDSGPVRGHYGAARMFGIWLAANLVVTTLLTGTLFVQGVPYTTVVPIILVGTLAGAAILVTVGAIGTRTGLSTMALTRPSFGVRGSLIPVAANVVILMGWSWVQAMLAGISLNFLVEAVTGFSNPVLFSVLCQCVVVVLAVFGSEGVARIEPWLAVCILALAAWVFLTAFSTYSPGELDLASINPVSVELSTNAGVFDVVLATAISWTVLSADLNRYARTPRAGVIGSGLGYTLSTMVAMTLGATAMAFVLLRDPAAAVFDPVTIIEPFGAPLAVAMFVSVMATNTMAVYGMVTSVVNAVPGSRVRFVPAALVLGTIAIIGATFFALLDQFTVFLFVISAVFAPVFAIVIADRYVIAPQNYTRSSTGPAAGDKRKSVGWPAIVAWSVGGLVAWAGSSLFPLAIGATIPSFLVTAALYVILSWSRRRARADGGAVTHGRPTA